MFIFSQLCVRRVYEADKSRRWALTRLYGRLVIRRRRTEIRFYRHASLQGIRCQGRLVSAWHCLTRHRQYRSVHRCCNRSRQNAGGSSSSCVASLTLSSSAFSSPASLLSSPSWEPTKIWIWSVYLQQILRQRKQRWPQYNTVDIYMYIANSDPYNIVTKPDPATYPKLTRHVAGSQGRGVARSRTRLVSMPCCKNPNSNCIAKVAKLWTKAPEKVQFLAKDHWKL